MDGFIGNIEGGKRGGEEGGKHKTLFLRFSPPDPSPQSKKEERGRKAPLD